MRLKDDIKARSPIVSKDEIRRKKREYWTKLLRVHKRRELTKKYSSEEKICFLQKMIAPPEEFADMTEDAKKAKKEIQEANMARTKARKLTKKALKSRLVPVFRNWIFNSFIFRILFSEEFIFFELCPESFLFFYLSPYLNAIFYSVSTISSIICY